MKYFLSAILFFYSLSVFASWYQNEDGGFGFYQPEGWSVSQDYRLSRMRGPQADQKQSDLVMGSDWVAGVTNLEKLKAELQGKYPKAQLQEAMVSSISGFQVQVKKYTEIYLLRQPENVILIRYLLQGSADQIAEGHEVLSSIEIFKENEVRP